MRRILPALVVLIALLATLQAAARPGGAGHNPPTRKLEAAFKVANHQRSVSKDGCYPAPSRVAQAIRQRKGFETGVARQPGSVRIPDIISASNRRARSNYARFRALSCPQLSSEVGGSGPISGPPFRELCWSGRLLEGLTQEARTAIPG
jgi:hypothetical protein